MGRKTTRGSVPPTTKTSRNGGRRTGKKPKIDPLDDFGLDFDFATDDGWPGDGGAPEPGAQPRPRPALRLIRNERDQFRRVLAEIARRKRESLRMYRPMPLQEAFHASHANERIIRGGNRGGKTLAAAIEVARALTGQDPHAKYPRENGRCIAVGKDSKHCAKVMYRKLFKPGAYEVIRDLETGQWRPALPIVDDDRPDDKRPAPPLIPQRFYSPKDVSWENKREEIPMTIRLKNGWEISFFSSLGAPPQGWDVDIVWFDEEIEHPLWYPEMSARLIDRRRKNARSGKRTGGKFLWSATPQAGTQKLYDLCQRADDCKGTIDPPIEEFHVTLLDNSYLTNEAKEEFVAKLEGNEDEIRIRVYGDFALLGRKVYPECMPKGVHGTQGFPIPDEWTRYCAIDPGRQVCAVLFAAVPPPGHPMAGRVFLYDELYIKKCSAQKFSEQMRLKIVGLNQSIRLALIDHHAGRQTEIGSGKTVEQQYRDALKGVAVSFDVEGFVWASDDVKGGIEAVRTGLAIVEGMSAKWVIFNDRCPWLCWEVGKYVYKKNPKDDVPTDEPLKINDHLMDCWRYLAMHNLRYVKPSRRRSATEHYTVAAMRAKRAKAQGRPGYGNSVKVG